VRKVSSFKREDSSGKFLGNIIAAFDLQNHGARIKTAATAKRWGNL
jgi:hypothetical protein